MVVPGNRSSSPSAAAWRRGPLCLVVGALLAVWACGGDQLLQPADPTDPDPDPNGPDVPTAPADVEVSVDLEDRDRIELTDSLVVHVEALDPSGTSRVDSIGFSAVIRGDGANGELGRTQVIGPSAAQGDTVSATFVLRPDWLSAPDLPADFTLQVYGWALTSAGDCGAAVPDSGDTLDCRNEQVGGTSLRIGSAGATPVPILAVPGRTTAFGSSSVIVGDLQVDTLRERAYVSNRLSNRLHVFEPTTFAWASDVSVGSEPWGLHLNSTGDTLLVANSGGTSISHVSLDGTPAEVVDARLQTRNTALFEIQLSGDGFDADEGADDTNDSGEGPLAEQLDFFDFSDRPQFVAQDAEGRVLYSTRPTVANPLGTIRVIERQQNWPEHETRILARLPNDSRTSDNTVSVLHADSIVLFEDGLVEIWDHPPGFPEAPFSSGIRRPLDALEYMTTQTESDIEFRAGRAWDIEQVSFADTTYVAASRDRDWVAFGDGGAPEVGKIVVWHGPTGTITRRLTVADLVNNASERVRALQLNDDGSLGIARGAVGTYFFSNDLRLRGTVPESVGGGGGAALHPDHPNTPAPSASGPTTVAFTVSGDRAIRILDTVHYQERGLLPIRDGISGPMRVTPPLPSDNNGQGRNCTGSDCVVAKVFAVTDSGGITVVDVRAADIGSVP